MSGGSPIVRVGITSNNIANRMVEAKIVKTKTKAFDLMAIKSREEIERMIEESQFIKKTGGNRCIRLKRKR